MTRTNKRSTHKKDTPSVKKNPSSIDPKLFLSSGSTMFNLALTDHPDCGYQKGKMVNLIGGTTSGKTLLAMTAFAEANLNPEFDDYLFIHDDAEFGNEFNLSDLFGKETEARIQFPKYDKDGDPNPSDTVQELHYNLKDYLEGDKPFIYILDSLDSLDSEEDESQLEAERKAHKEGKEVSGSYGTGKPKRTGHILRDVTKHLKKTNSILIIISQIRENIGYGFAKYRRAGGKALEFYSTQEIWVQVAETFKFKNRVIGADSLINVTKNRITGKKRQISLPMKYEFGIDNPLSCINFLINEKYWTKSKGSSKFSAPDFNFEGEGNQTTIQNLIKHIEDNEMEGRLKQITAVKWKSIEESLLSGRKKRYKK